MTAPHIVDPAGLLEEALGDASPEPILLLAASVDWKKEPNARKPVGIRTAARVGIERVGRHP